MNKAEMTEKDPNETPNERKGSTPITDENGYEIGYYNDEGKEQGIYVFVTNDRGEQVFFLHTNSVEKACGAIISYHQTLQAYCK